MTKQEIQDIRRELDRLVLMAGLAAKSNQVAAHQVADVILERVGALARHERANGVQIGYRRVSHRCARLAARYDKIVETARGVDYLIAKHRRKIYRLLADYFGTVTVDMGENYELVEPSPEDDLISA